MDPRRSLGLAGRRAGRVARGAYNVAPDPNSATRAYFPMPQGYVQPRPQGSSVVKPMFGLWSMGLSEDASDTGFSGNRDDAGTSLDAPGEMTDWQPVVGQPVGQPLGTTLPPMDNYLGTPEMIPSGYGQEPYNPCQSPQVLSPDGLACVDPLGQGQRMWWKGPDRGGDPRTGPRSWDEWNRRREACLKAGGQLDALGRCNRGKPTLTRHMVEYPEGHLAEMQPAGRVARGRTSGEIVPPTPDQQAELRTLQGYCAIMAPEGFFLRPEPTWGQNGPHYAVNAPIAVLAASTETNAGNRMYRVKTKDGAVGYAVFALENMRNVRGVCPGGFAGLATFSAPVPSGGGGGGGTTPTCTPPQTLVGGRCVTPAVPGVPPVGPATDPGKSGAALLIALGVAGLALVYVNRRPIRKALGM